ncbi:hypothetical protein [Micromonospora sp. KC606]|nr:hypothetical protein [Micromonospora sp. KC606]
MRNSSGCRAQDGRTRRDTREGKPAMTIEIFIISDRDVCGIKG